MLHPAGHRISLWVIVAAGTITTGRCHATDDMTRRALMSAGYARESTIPFTTPTQIASSEGYLSTRLDVRMAHHQIGGRSVTHRSYNGLVVGPTLRVRPGDLLRIRLWNRLPLEGASGDDSLPHQPNVTNLHTHGLHVSPKSNSDNPFVQVLPRQYFDYCFDVPADHPAGTFWYHAHKHGSVAFQLSSGMAGALVVSGGIDEIPEIRKARERIFVFQQLLFRHDSGEIDPVEAYKSAPDPDVVNVDTTINGVFAPVIYLRPGEVERWRFIHAGLAETLDVGVRCTETNELLELHELAVDGLALKRIRKRTSILLQPGNRSDILIQAPNTCGEYLVVNQEVEAKKSITGVAQPISYLAKLVITGKPCAMAIPDADSTGPYALPSLTGPIDRRRSIEFFAKSSTDQFEINGQEFDEHHLGLVPNPVVGSVEEWTLTARAGLHPFHIHINPFEVITTDPITLQSSTEWRDTIFVTQESPVTVRMLFKRFSGKTVLHCHNLVHEDRGMMMAFAIDPRTPRNSSVVSDGPLSSSRGRDVPRWTLEDASHKLHRSEDFLGRRLLVLLFQSTACDHCLEQLFALAAHRAELLKLGITTVAVFPEDPDLVRRLSNRNRALRDAKFVLLADSDESAFDAFGCRSEGIPQHGAFFITATGEIAWSLRPGNRPPTAAEILLQLRRSQKP